MNTRDELIKTWVAAEPASKLSQLFAKKIGHLADAPLESIFDQDLKRLKAKEIHNAELSNKLADVVARNMKECFAEEVKVEINDGLEQGETVEFIEAKLQKKMQLFSELLETAAAILKYDKNQELTREVLEKSLKQFIQLTELALEPYLIKDKKGLENLPKEVMSAFIGFYHAVELKSEQVFETHKSYEERLDRLAEDNCFSDWADSDDPLKIELNQKINKLFSQDYNSLLRKIANSSELNDFLLDKQFGDAYSRIEGFHALLKDIYKIVLCQERDEQDVFKTLAHNLIPKLTAACRNFIKDPYGEGQKIMADMAGVVVALNEEVKKIRVEQAALVAERQGICWACFMKTTITALTKRIDDKKAAAQKLLETILDIQGLVEKYPQFKTAKTTSLHDLLRPATKHHRQQSYSSMNLERLAGNEVKKSLKRLKSRRSIVGRNLAEINEVDELPGKPKKGW